MSKNDIKLDVTTINEKELSDLISTKFKDLTELENSVKEAFNLATKAKAKAQNAQVSAGLFKKKAAIELLQDVVKGNAEAQISIVDAQKLLFEYQTQLTEITKFLFGLGVCNIVMNRTVVRELELKLKGASEEEISDLAKKELCNVIRQLKAQEDMMKTQEFIKGKVKEQAGQINYIDKKLDDIDNTDREQDQKIAEHTKKIAEKDIKDKKQDQKIAEHAKKIEEKDIKDEIQDQRIAEHAKKIAEKEIKDERQDQKIAEHAKKIAEKEIKDEKQDRDIAEHTEKLDEHHKALKEQQEKDRQFEKMFAEQDIEDEQQDQRIAKNEKLLSLHEEKLEQHQQSQEMFEWQLSEVQHNLSDNIERLKESVDESNIAFVEKLDNLKNEFNVSIDSLKSLVDRNKESSDDISSKIAERVTAIELFNSKKFWKIGVSVVAVISLILNILQIIGII